MAKYKNRLIRRLTAKEERILTRNRRDIWPFLEKNRYSISRARK
jgi:hypothetical protein